MPEELRNELIAFEKAQALNDPEKLEKTQEPMQRCPICQETLAKQLAANKALVQINCPGKHILCEQCLNDGPDTNKCALCRGSIESFPN